MNRWAFPGIRTHSEFYCYLDTRETLDLLADRRQLELHPQMLEEIRSHREKDYAGAAIRGQHLQHGFSRCSEEEPHAKRTAERLGLDENGIL